MTEEQLLALNPCPEGLAFAELCNFDFVKIWHTCPRGDWLLWLLHKTNNITKKQAVHIAIEFAQATLPLFERKYPDDRRPRKAIEAAQNWLSNPSFENMDAAHVARLAAYEAADAAYTASLDATSFADANASAAAYSAADAAAATTSVAVAFADTSAVASAVAYAAGCAAAAARIATRAIAAYDAAAARAAYEAEQLRQANKIRELISCPFN